MVKLFALGVGDAVILETVAVEVGRADGGGSMSRSESIEGVDAVCNVNGTFLLVRPVSGVGSVGPGRFQRLEAARGRERLCTRDVRTRGAGPGSGVLRVSRWLLTEGEVTHVSQRSLLPLGLRRAGGDNNGSSGMNATRLGLGTESLTLSLIDQGSRNLRRRSRGRDGMLLMLHFGLGLAGNLTGDRESSSGNLVSRNRRGNDHGRDGGSFFIVERQPNKSRADAAFLEQLLVGARDSLDLNLEEELAEALLVIQPIAKEHQFVPLREW